LKIDNNVITATTSNIYVSIIQDLLEGCGKKASGVV